MSSKLILGLALVCLQVAGTAVQAETAATADQATQRGEVSSPFGIPGQQPVSLVWQQFLAGSDLTRASNAAGFMNELFSEKGAVDPQACKSKEQGIREALAEIPVSVGMWLYGGRCAELNGDDALAAQSEQVLAALLESSLSHRRLASYAQPIPVLGENDIYAIIELTGETLLAQIYEVPATGRYMRLIVSLKDEDSGRQSSLYFDFLDNYVQLARDIPELQFPAGRQQFAREVLRNMDGSAPAELARDSWDALTLGSIDERAQAIRDLAKKEGDYRLWTGMLCISVEVFGCADDGVELILPYAEAGYADAYVSLAMAYAEGRGVERDDAAARDMLAEANRAVGAPNAEIALQALLQSIHGKTALHPLVAETLRDAARGNDPVASLLVALDTGDWSQDTVPEAALPLLQTAANGGAAIALGLIGRHHLDASDAEKGIAMLLQAAQAGDDASAEALGRVYALGEVVARDSEQSRHWLLVAAQSGRVSAMKMLAFDYQNSGGAENSGLAERWYANAVVRGDLQAALQMAIFLSTEPEGVKDTVKRALSIFEELIADHDSDPARLNLALWQLQSAGPVHAPEKAEQLLRAAGNGESAIARTVYVSESFAGRLPGADMEQAQTWLESEIKGSDPVTVIPLAGALINAKAEYRDIPRALQLLDHWWQEQGNGTALNELAWLRCTSADAEIFSVEQSAILGPALTERADGNLAWLDTVAACHAAVGEFEQAVAVQAEVIAQVESQVGDLDPTVQGMRGRLALYGAGKRAEEALAPTAD